MAIYSDAGALVGTWWNQVTQPQGPRGPIDEITVAPAALTARTDLAEAGQALGQPLPAVIGTGRVDGVYFIGGVETVGTTTYTTTTSNTIPPGYQAVSGTLGGQTFLFGPGPRTTTTSTTTYDNRTLAGYVLAYDYFERGYNLIRLEIDGEVVFDAENNIPATATFRFYGGRHTTVDPILTQMIGTNPGAYENFVMIFIDGYPADSPPSISAVISNATTDQEESARIEWIGENPAEPLIDETQAGYQSAYDPTDLVILEALTQWAGGLTHTDIQLAVLDVNTKLERYRVSLEGTDGVNSVVHVKALRNSGHALVSFGLGSPVRWRYAVYNIVTGAKVAEFVESATAFLRVWNCSQSFDGKYCLMGIGSGTTTTHFAVIDIAAATIDVTSATGFAARWWIHGRETAGGVSFFGFKPATLAAGDALVYEYTFDGSAWSYRLAYTAPAVVQALHYDPLTEYLVMAYAGPAVAYVLPDTGAVVATFATDFLFDMGNMVTAGISWERYWPKPGYALWPRGASTGDVYLLDIAGRTWRLYADLSVTQPWTGIYDQNQWLYIVGIGNDVWIVYYLPNQVPQLVDLDEIVTDSMSLAGFGSADLTFVGFGGLSTWGFVVASDTTVQTVVRAISDIYGFAWCDTGSGFVFKKPGQGASLAIDAAFDTPDIVERDQPVMTQDEANIRTPSSVEMQYVSKEGQYKARPTSFNLTTGVLNSITTPKFSTPILFNDAEAQRIVQEKFFEFQEKRRSHTLAVAPENIILLPGDVVSFPSGTRTYITRIEEVGIDLRNMGVEISARDFQTDVESPTTAVSNTGPVWAVVHHASGDVTGQTLAVSVGTVTVTAGAAGAAFATVTGQAATVSVGGVVAGGNVVSASVTGQGMMASVGTADVTISGGGGSDPSFSSVVLLAGFNGTDASTTFVDESSAAHTLTAVGNAQIDTAQSKFGGASALFDGSGDYITAADSADWNFGSGQFTVEAFVRFADASTYRTFVAQGDFGGGASDAWFLDFHAFGYLRFVYTTDGNSVNSVQQPWSPSTGVWYHVAADRSASNDIRIYIDGVMQAKSNVSTATIFNSTKPLTIGSLDTGNHYHNGWIDELRITKGVARYASDSGYTVPTAAYPRS